MNPPIERQDDSGVEVVVATSGRALLLVRSKALGEDVVARVTRRALEEAPGAVVHGYVSNGTLPVDCLGKPGSDGALHDLVEEVHAEAVRAKLLCRLSDKRHCERSAAGFASSQ